MARLESVAVGGYFPTPPSVVQLVSSCLTAEGTTQLVNFLDPCAGEGEAISSLASAIGDRVHVFTLEMEQTRAEVCKRKFSYGNALHGDAFYATWTHNGASLLWLNPPYDLDKKHKRLEERFLARFSGALKPDGVLAFIVPYYALAASAATLARAFTDLECFRFPESDFDAYKQVVLFATKRKTDLLDPDPNIAQQVAAWASDHTSIPVLQSGVTNRAIPTADWRGMGSWSMGKIDTAALLSEFRLWHTDGKGGPSPLPGMVPDTGALSRTYQLAMPPRPAHVATAIASGIFNGRTVKPDNPSSGLPDILVKGVFDKEFKKVEEKKNKKGEVVAQVEVQQPKLVTTVLNLNTFEYSVVQDSANKSNATAVESMTMGDLVGAYGAGLMAAMRAQCPVLHDPRDPEGQITLPELARPLFPAQHQVAQATVKLLGGPGIPISARRGKGAFILGELGSGKTGTSLAVSKAIGARSALVLCPPHLLDSWKEQAAAVVPEVEVTILDSISDLHAYAEARAREPAQPRLAVLSREKAKLGHSWISAKKTCPKCGAKLEKKDYSKTRATCDQRPIVYRGPLAKTARRLAHGLRWAFPSDQWLIQTTLSDREVALMAKASKAKTEAAWDRFVQNDIHAVAFALADNAEEPGALDALEALVAAHPDPDLILAVVDRLLLGVTSFRAARGRLMTALTILLYSPAERLLTRFEGLEKAFPVEKYDRMYDTWREKRASLWEGGNGTYYFSNLSRTGSVVSFAKHPLGSRFFAVTALAHLKDVVKRGRECGEPLYQAAAKPRRYPLATYICSKFPTLFDLLILDEGHEYQAKGSAQEVAAHRLTGLGLPTLFLSGTVMNGYAESLFTNSWAMSPKFREEFGHSEIASFINRYGYRKRLVQDKDEDGVVVAFGSQSDRVERSYRMTGRAPGVLPLFLFQHLLPMAVTLHKEDLRQNIPQCTQLTIPVSPSQKQKTEYEVLKSALVTRIQTDMFSDLHGKLWGAMAHFPSMLDLLTRDTGNEPSGTYVVRYPESVGGNVVVRSSSVSEDEVLPKEQWLLDHLSQATAEGRNVLVFAWHGTLIPRLARLISTHLGEPCPVLDAAKVATHKRQAWIEKEVIKKKRKVLVVNPVAVQTGLNNLVHFSDQVWMENPSCNPIVYRQAVGRVDRIGQTKPTRIYFPIYEDTLQETMHSLLMHKVGVSLSTDGHDAEEALRAAGVGEGSTVSTFSIGRQLFEAVGGAID